MIRWQDINTVLLDMDGTLLDLYFDNRFWLEYLPQQYAKANNISVADAKTQLFREFSTHRGTLNWYCLDYWAAKTGLDIVGLKQHLKDLIDVRPNAIAFLQRVKQSGRTTVLATNAHRGSLDLKLQQLAEQQAPLTPYLDVVVSAHDLGLPKEDLNFWSKLQDKVSYDPAKTLLIDDNLDVLRSARKAGIGQTLAVLFPDSHKTVPIDTEEFIGIDCFSSIFPQEPVAE